jgi:hypothetical protein
VQIGGYSKAPYSARYLEVRFETIAVVGHLSQSKWTGRAFGHPKSRRLFSLLGGAERRAGIVVLPPRSTFPQFEKSKSEGRLKLQDAHPKDSVSRFRNLGLPAELVDTRGTLSEQPADLESLETALLRAREIAEEFDEALILYFIDMAIAELRMESSPTANDYKPHS